MKTMTKKMNTKNDFIYSCGRVSKDANANFSVETLDLGSMREITERRYEMILENIKIHNIWANGTNSQGKRYRGIVDRLFEDGNRCVSLMMGRNIDADDYEEWLSQCVDYGWFIIKMA